MTDTSEPGGDGGEAAAAAPAAPEERCCYSCRWNSYEFGICGFFEARALPRPAPFWAERVFIAYVALSEGANCGAWSAR